jgi:hypothetical protein
MIRGNGAGHKFLSINMICAVNHDRLTDPLPNFAMAMPDA